MSDSAQPASRFCPTKEEAEKSVRSGVEHLIHSTHVEVKSIVEELAYECVPTCKASKVTKGIWTTLKSWIYTPYVPAIHRPGWFLFYLLGPYDDAWREGLIADCWAGITVAMLLIPQGLSVRRLVEWTHHLHHYNHKSFHISSSFIQYAQLANLPPINGLYCALLPSATYTFFGSSMMLAVGPVAIVSLLMGSLVSQYGVEVGSEAAVNFAGECCLAMGSILLVLSFLNMGNFIRYLSYPVMTGFTAAAACLIGLNQIKLMFGFTGSYYPQTGDGYHEDNYEVMEWIVHNFYAISTYAPTGVPTPSPTLGPITGAVTAPTPMPSAKPTITFAPSRDQYKLAVKNKEIEMAAGHPIVNPYNVQICFGLWICLAVINMIKKRFKETPARKKNWCFFIWQLMANISPFFAIIIGAGIAAKIKKDDKNNNWDYTCNGTRYPTPYLRCARSSATDSTQPVVQILDTIQHDWYAYALKCVGDVPSGLNIARVPRLEHPFGQLIIDVLPLTLIAFMESYSVARKLATIKNQLHLLNASQEMFAVGLGNILGSVTSAYPVAGSFSRSSLNMVSGARTPLSKFTTTAVILLAVGAVSESFGYIPNAALGAVVMASISSLVDLRDFWNAWKYSKKDFCVMLFTAAITFVFDTKWGLVAGIGMSLIVYIGDVAFGATTAPKLVEVSKDNDGIDVVSIESNVVFLNASRIKDFITSLTTVEEKPVTEEDGKLDYIKYKVRNTFDRILTPQLLEGMPEMPKALIIDLAAVRVIDLTGMHTLKEVAADARVNGCLVVFINLVPELLAPMAKFGIKSDSSSDKVDLEKYLQFNGLPKLAPNSPKLVKVDAPGSLNVELIEIEDDEEQGAAVRRGSGVESTSTRSRKQSFSEKQMTAFEYLGTEDPDDEWTMKNGGRVKKTIISKMNSSDSNDHAAAVMVVADKEV